MQKAVRDYFLVPTGILQSEAVELTAAMVVEFWQAVTDVLPGPWSDPRAHLITKGVGVYALTGLMGQNLPRERLCLPVQPSRIPRRTRDHCTRG